MNKGYIISRYTSQWRTLKRHYIKEGQTLCKPLLRCQELVIEEDAIVDCKKCLKIKNKEELWQLKQKYITQDGMLKKPIKVI